MHMLSVVIWIGDKISSHTSKQNGNTVFFILSNTITHYINFQ